MGVKIASLFAEIGADVSGLVKGLNQSDAALAKTAANAKKAEKAAADHAEQMNKVGKIAGGIALAGITAVSAAIVDSVKETMDYTKAMRDLAQNLGMTIEETSRLVQVADDFTVSQESVTTAMQMMVKRGVAPSIEGLAKIADQYNAIKDPVKQAALMTELLGRNWTALTPMLKEGGDAIRANAAAQSDALIVTEEMSKKTRELEIGIDNLNDKLLALKLKVGNALVPVLTDATDAFGFLTDGINSADAVENQYTSTIAKLVVLRGAESHEVELATKMLRDYLALKQSVGISVSERTLRANMAEVKSLQKIDAAMVEARDGLLAYAEAAQTGGKASEDFGRWLEEGVTAKMSDLAVAMGGAVKSEMESFNERQNALKTRAIELQGVISSSYGQVKADAIASLQSVNAELETNAAKHEEATKRILFGYAEQNLALDGLTTTEGDALDALAVKWGLKSKSDVDAMKAIQEAGKQLANDKNIDKYGNSVDAAMKKVQQQAFIAEMYLRGTGKAIADLPKNTDINVNIRVNGAGALDEIGGKIGGAIDDNLPEKKMPTIPPAKKPDKKDKPDRRETKATGGPVVAGRTYLVGENGPETLIMGASGGMVVPGKNTSNTTNSTSNNTFNIYAAPGMDVQAIADAVSRRLGARANSRQRMAI
jgi:hypothetical protein